MLIALPHNIRFEHLSYEDGLPDSSIFDMVQDNDGFVWFATRNGVARYDGFTLKHFQLSQSKANQSKLNDTRVLHIDLKGDLWVGSMGGLSRFDSITESFDHTIQTHFLQSGISSHRIIAIESLDKDGLWVATSNELIKADLNALGTIAFSRQALPSRFQNINSISRSSDGDMWLGTQAGLVVYQHDSKQFVPVATLKNLNSQNISNLYFSDREHLWFTTNEKNSNVYRLNIKTNTVKQFLIDLEIKRTLSIKSDASGNIWLGTYNQGVFLIQPDGQAYNYRHDKGAYSSLSENIVLSIMVDQSNTLWVGTYKGGVNHVDLMSLNFGLIDDSQSSLSCLKSPRMFAINESNALPSSLSKTNTEISYLWLGTKDGLVKVDRKNATCHYFSFSSSDERSIPHNTVYSLFNDNDEFLYIGTANGLARLDLKSNIISRVNHELPSTVIYFIEKDQQNTLFVGTPSGLYRQLSTESEFELVNAETEALKMSEFYGFSFDSKNQLWASTPLGLVFLDKRDDRLHFARWEQQKVADTIVGAVYIDKNDTVWVGVDDVALIQFNPITGILKQHKITKKQKPISFQSILSSNDANLWISSSQGLVRIDRQTGNYRMFGIKYGLQSEEYMQNTAFGSRTGLLYFGGLHGLNELHPKRITHHRNAPKTLLTELYRFNRPVTPNKDKSSLLNKPLYLTDALKLSHLDYVFSVEFSSIHFANSQANEYAYKLEGWDNEWNYTQFPNRRATYTNLPAADYTLFVKSANVDGVWDEKGASLSITVLPPTWLTWWAKILYAVLVVSLLIFLHLYRTQRLTKRTAKLEAMVLKRTEELHREKNTVEQLMLVRNQEFANVSHEFRTPLTLILGPVKRLLQKSVLSRDKETLTVIQRNGLRLLRLVDQILQLERINVGKVLEKKITPCHTIVSLIAQSFKELCEKKSIELTIEQMDEVYLPLIPDSIEKIVLNLLSNALKYTPKNGRIFLSCGRIDETFIFEVSDTGIGIENENIDRIFEKFNRIVNEQSEYVTGAGIGLSLVRELIVAHNGVIDVQSELGIGTTFRVCIPGAKAESSVDNGLAVNEEIVSIELENLNSIHIDEHEISVDEQSKQDERLSILVIEDNADMRRHISAILSKKYYCLFAKNGQEGIETAVQFVPDLIISDIMMPIKDGYDVCQHLKKESTTSHIPILLLTARGDKESRLRGWKEYADEYITKPFDEEELVIRVENLLVIRDLLRKRFGQLYGSSPQLLTEQNKEVLTEPKSPEIEDLSDVSNFKPLEVKFIERLNQVLEQHYTNPNLTIQMFSVEVALSERQLNRKLQAILNMTPSEVIREYRLSKGKVLLEKGVNPSTVAFDVGFTSHSYFSKCFKAKYGETPSSFLER